MWEEDNVSDKSKSGGKKQLSGRIIKSLNKISGEYVAGLTIGVVLLGNNV